MGNAGILRGTLTLALAAGALSLPAPAADASWVQDALAQQYELGSGVPLRNAPWVGTHNSFNSEAEMGPTLSDQDPNQRIALVDQLELGIRSLELDVHWFPHAPAAGNAPVVCHATGEHGGCTIEKTLREVLEEISAWLRRPENRDQVLLLYLEDHLDTEEGYDEGAAAVEEVIGELLHHPSGPGCTELPLELTRAEIRAAGAQAVIVSDCGVGSGWPGVVHSWDAHEETRPRGYTDFPGCGTDFSAQQYEGTLIRYYEDSTQLTANLGDPDDGITPPTAAAMARCGVDLIGLDQLVPEDPRLEARVWSWAPDQPDGGRCAVQRLGRTFPLGRWFSIPCEARRRVACERDGSWIVAEVPVRHAGARRQCAEQGALHAVPHTGREAQKLRLAMQRAGARRVWLAYRRGRAGWRESGGAGPKRPA